MKKLQIMAGMLSVLLLAGCGGAGASAKTTEGDPPQVASAAASGTTAAQNGNENPSEVVTQDEAERPGPVDAEPSGEKKTTSSAGETKPKAEDPPVQVLPAETVPPEAPPTESDPSKPVTDETAPQPEEKGFDMDYKYWKSVIDLRRCMECKKHQGKIYLLYDIIPEEPPLHPNCRCSVQRLEAKTPGPATKIGLRGAIGG